MFQSLYLAVVHVYLTLQQIEAISYHSVHRSADFWVNVLSLEFAIYMREKTHVQVFTILPIL